MLNFSLVISWMLCNEMLTSVKRYKFLLDSAALLKESAHKGVN